MQLYAFVRCVTIDASFSCWYYSRAHGGKDEIFPLDMRKFVCNFSILDLWTDGKISHICICIYVAVDEVRWFNSDAITRDSHASWKWMFFDNALDVAKCVWFIFFSFLVTTNRLLNESIFSSKQTQCITCYFLNFSYTWMKWRCIVSVSSIMCMHRNNKPDIWQIGEKKLLQCAECVQSNNIGVLCVEYDGKSNVSLDNKKLKSFS